MQKLELNPALSQQTRYAFLILCGSLSYFLCNYFFSILFEKDSWNLGDWLINYESGLVRRGLIGQIIISLGDTFNINIKWISFILQSITWACIYYLTFKIYTLRIREKEWLLFLLSPAFLLFPFFDMGAGLRKEIILFLSFAILAYAFARNKLSNTNILLSYLMFLIATFSHELSTLATIFFIFIFYRSYQLNILNAKQVLIYSAIFLLTAFFAGIFSILFQGDKLIATGICNSLTTRGLDDYVCTGAIRWIGFDSQNTMQHMHERLTSRTSRYLINYPFTILLTIAPLLLLRPLSKQTKFILIFGFICFLPLYAIGSDWYRWIYIYATLTFLYILSESKVSNFTLKPINGWIIFLYLTLWSVHSTSGWFSFFNYLLTRPEKVFSI